jgi:hypothetical protein
MLVTGMWLLRIAAVAFVVLGAVAFVLPGFASAQGNFPWKVGPFLAMTIGGWSLGTAAIAADAARDLRPARVYPLIAYLGVFALGQSLVLVAFADRVQLGAVLTWTYLVGLSALLVGAVLTVLAWRGEAGLTVCRGSVPRWAQAAAGAFAVFVGGLALGTSLAGPDGTVAQGRVFPEAMSLFSMRAFSAFLFALAVSAATLLAAREALPYHELARAGLYLIVPITMAAFLNLGLFDGARPGSIFYLVTYLLVGVGLVAVLWQQRGDPAVHPT